MIHFLSNFSRSSVKLTKEIPQKIERIARFQAQAEKKAKNPVMSLAVVAFLVPM